MVNISELFEKDIHRNINGVIKVGQQDSENIRQELEEYVITRELDKHFRSFFDRYTEALERPTDKMGVWISGFFGSGKSHFLKILSYLLSNYTLGARQAVEYFDEKRVPDPMLRAKITQAARTSADVILFNIDSKAAADSKNDKEAIVKVFQKVFDEHLGYFGAVPAIAEFERQLDAQGKYEAFQQAFLDASGLEWKEQRDAWAFYQDEMIQALRVCRGMSEEAAKRLLNFTEQNYHLSVERFALTVREYLETKSPKHRLIFMVDEVGQYVGDNSSLMLNLQTVVEDLGVHCYGRAWVVVTSQEAMDEITKGKLKGDDFSKIVGRFHRPLSLSSANTDEVIKLRLLRKKEEVLTYLKSLYDREKSAVLKNQITFTQDCAEMPGYSNATDFAAAYPFIPYQFNLLQRVFTEIRVMGAAGKHLSSGERSLLDAFQIASQAVDQKNIGALVPFHTFYLAIQGFLDSAVSQVITQAEQNSQLQPFDIDLLKTLFMIKYIKEIRANVDNLTTLSLDQIDQDKRLLKQQVEESLARLEKQTLIQRSGDEYSFLTHEEQDIGREIKRTQIDPAEVIAEFQKLVWDSIFTDKKFKYDSRHQYGFNRKLDDQNYGQAVNDFTLHIITPYCDRYTDLSDAACMMATGSGQEILVRLPEDDRLLEEADELVKTDKYLRRKNSGNLTDTVQRILIARSDENTRRRERVENALRKLLAQGTVFACGDKVETSSRDAQSVLKEGLGYLVRNIYKKLDYIESWFDSEDQVTNAFVRDEQVQNLDGQALNHRAHQEMQTWLDNEAKAYRRVTIRDLTDKFASRPWGWSELDTLGVMAELVNKGAVELRKAQSTVSPRSQNLIKLLRSRTGQDEYQVRLGDAIDPASLRVAKDVANDFLSEQPPGDSLKLYEAYEKALSDRTRQLQTWLSQAETETLPFRDLIQEQLTLLQQLRGTDSAAAFFNFIKEHREEVEDHVDDYDKLKSFFTTQITSFKKAKNDLIALEPELRHIQDQQLLDKVDRAKAILALSDPTRDIPQLEMLLKPVQNQVRVILQQRQQETSIAANRVRESVQSYAASAYGELSTRINLADVTRSIDTVEGAAQQATTIDSAIARQSELEQLESRIIAQVDQQAQALLQQTPAGESVEVPTLPIVPVKLASLSAKPILETVEEVDQYLAVVRQKLIQEIGQNQRVRLE
ncbi:BREX system P-loop protein BrxC [Pseudanabaenaceae cyanobacterium LEGE 13415]|nr:BREX system P-loop protein BrxC [Pseudanabaenaceae cyanobacterium LEGE 13415]